MYDVVHSAVGFSLGILCWSTLFYFAFHWDLGYVTGFVGLTYLWGFVGCLAWQKKGQPLE